jgi:hypothetical protein
LAPGKLIRLLLGVLALALAVTGTALAAPKHPAKEPFFPHAGDRGYDALRYHVRLVYSPAGTIKAVMAMRARARTRLHTVRLDLDGLDVSGSKSTAAARASTAATTSSSSTCSTRSPRASGSS